MPKNTEEFECGFSITTSSEYVLKENFIERRGREPNDEEWEQINKDVSIAECNALRYIREKLGNACDEGHCGDGDLIGSCWTKWENRDALELIVRYHVDYGQEIDLPGDPILNAYKDVSEVGMDAFDVRISFFSGDDDDLERLENLTQ